MSAKARNIDFSNVKEGGNFNKKRIPAGDYAAIITKVEDAVAKGDEVPQYLFSIKIKNRPASVFPYYCKLQENQLWKLRNILIAGGKSVPKSKSKVDPNSVVGKTIGVTIEDTEYEGKDQSEIAGVFPAAELTELEIDDEVADDEDEDDDEDVDDLEATSTDDDDEELADEEEEVEDEGDEWDAITDRLELRKALKKVAPDVQTKSSHTEDDIRDLIRAAVAGAADDDDEELEEEEPEPPKKKTKPAAKAAPAKKAKKKAADIDDEDLEELDIDEL